MIAGRLTHMMESQREVAGRGRYGAVLVALAVSLTGIVMFGSLVAGLGDWVEGRDLPVVLPWALPGPRRECSGHCCIRLRRTHTARYAAWLTATLEAALLQ